MHCMSMVSQTGRINGLDVLYNYIKSILSTSSGILDVFYQVGIDSMCFINSILSTSSAWYLDSRPLGRRKRVSRAAWNRGNL